MPRTVPSQHRADLMAENSPHALLAFMTITHENLMDPIRLVSDPTDFIVNGHRFVGCPFDFTLLTDEDEAPTTQLRVQNVDRRIGEAIRMVSDRAQVQLDVRSTADFDLSEIPRKEKVGGSVALYGFKYFDLIDVTANVVEITGTLMIRDYTQEPWPGKRATQSRCPGLFR